MALPVVDMERIRESITKAGLSYIDHESGLVLVKFINGIFVFEIIDDVQVLKVFGWWFGQTQDDDLQPKLQEFAEQRNRITYLPRLIVDQDEGFWRLYFAFATPIAAGLTDEQLADFLEAVFSTGTMALNEAEQRFPELVTWEQEA
ncbi:YbjN domain-containing protein [Corynebacterium sp. HS2168-gen11]|uniref:YbjN domain-containing protein n=1 Tax=Corynebacterium sp. HS2168-gen11 TaxID=2974027 RepID=UPI00216B4B02|nr:YbjN domain-containing protein [Corynebacterium sp. HS2168-gen11]MCS4534995.1 YbjN domain-containing protein [Corynebacterium sp. HS2168-gen11]